MPFSLVFCLSTYTNNALMSIKEKIQAYLDKNGLTTRVFIDMKKTYDTVNHDTLLTKLDHYEIRELANDCLAHT